MLDGHIKLAVSMVVETLMYPVMDFIQKMCIQV
jgi:hypothetical protein